MSKLNDKTALGPLREQNLAQYFKWRNTPDLWRWCRQSDVLQWYAHIDWFNGLRDRTDLRMYEILAPKEKCVGVCGLTSIDQLNQRAEFSLYVAPEHQGTGYGKSALALLLSHGFRHLNLNVIWGESFDGNPALQMFEALGFVNEGRRRDFYFRDGKFIDAHLVSMRRAEWIS